MSDGGGPTGPIREMVVGVDGSPASDPALRWAAATLAPGGRLHAVHVLSPVEELALDAVLGDSVKMLHHRERELADEWLAPLAGASFDVQARVVEGSAAAALLAVAGEVGADAIVVGHRPAPRFGNRVVGHVTADLIRDATLPVVVVPETWDPGRPAAGPIVVGVGIAEATRSAVRWAMAMAAATGDGLSMIHAMSPRTLFRPDGLLDVLAYYLDPAIVPEWVEEDLVAMAAEVAAEADLDVAPTVSVRTGRIGPRLVEAGTGATMLVVGRGDAPFTPGGMAAYLRHALVHAPCPVVVVPPDAVDTA